MRKSARKMERAFQLSRATLCARDVATASTLVPNGPLRRRYDIVAIQPLSSSVLEEVSHSEDDLISRRLSLTTSQSISSAYTAVTKAVQSKEESPPASFQILPEATSTMPVEPNIWPAEPKQLLMPDQRFKLDVEKKKKYIGKV